ncbi:hypothetical protein [Clostridium perfringens]|uniref:hypothetical protein n=1 Tax=Clostridium perfringens TaxID=1502 RepID=UPI000E15B502|nr:hypothetical protein [Clostridium perfringens]EJT6533414.1 hypothetical protein [Clostridium perfringens]MDH2459528.1 hypothetical protein [Clostridium perfringens]MDH5085881.1 hypothetical protein [Clostridium perfringens]MDU2086007.1 hypothetical protein [Clostridium perfringens]MDU2470858.1 hypothetical protein [Clostridium perfringens]
MKLVITISNLDKSKKEVDEIINKISEISNIKEVGNSMTNNRFERNFVEIEGK